MEEHLDEEDNLPPHTKLIRYPYQNEELNRPRKSKKLLILDLDHMPLGLIWEQFEQYSAANGKRRIANCWNF